MSEETSPVSSPTVSSETPTLTDKRKKVAPRKTKKSPIENQVQTRGHVKQSELVKWTVFVRPEVKIAVQKAAKKAGITDTAWLDVALWDAATADLMKKAQPPARPEDLVADIVKQFADQIETRQAATAEQQNAIIKEQGEQLAALAKAIQNQPAPPPAPSLKELIFGRPKKS